MRRYLFFAAIASRSPLIGLRGERLPFTRQLQISDTGEDDDGSRRVAEGDDRLARVRAFGGAAYPYLLAEFLG